MSSKAVISSSVSKMAASSSSTKIVSKKVSSSSAVTSKTYSYRSGAAPDDSNVTIEYIHDVSNVSRLEDKIRLLMEDIEYERELRQRVSKPPGYVSTSTFMSTIYFYMFAIYLYVCFLPLFIRTYQWMIVTQSVHDVCQNRGVLGRRLDKSIPQSTMMMETGPCICQRLVPGTPEVWDELVGGTLRCDS
nr:uncharacterized protein LOC113805120 [Penaeus vannamei]